MQQKVNDLFALEASFFLRGLVAGNDVSFGDLGQQLKQSSQRMGATRLPQPFQYYFASVV